MRFFLFLLWNSLSVSLITGGIFAFAFGTLLKTSLQVHGLWIFDGQWNYADYCFLGAILTSIGAGMRTASVLSQRHLLSDRGYEMQRPNRSSVSNAEVLAELANVKQQLSDSQNTVYNYHLSVEQRLSQIEAQPDHQQSDRTVRMDVSPRPVEDPQQNYSV